ncbi:hypothetical protein ACS0TY_013252 [Phlomoides rotata]
MVAKLAGSLAHVTCKEPIHGSISGQLRNSLQGLGIANELLDQESRTTVQPVSALLVSEHSGSRNSVKNLFFTESHRYIALSSYGLLLGVIAEVPSIILRCISRDEAPLAAAHKAFKGLYENASNSALVDAHLVILVVIRDVSKLVFELTSMVLDYLYQQSTTTQPINK